MFRLFYQEIKWKKILLLASNYSNYVADNFYGKRKKISFENSWWKSTKFIFSIFLSTAVLRIIYLSNHDQTVPDSRQAIQSNYEKKYIHQYWEHSKSSCRSFAILIIFYLTSKNIFKSVKFLPGHEVLPESYGSGMVFENML